MWIKCLFFLHTLQENFNIFLLSIKRKVQLRFEALLFVATGVTGVCETAPPNAANGDNTILEGFSLIVKET